MMDRWCLQDSTIIKVLFSVRIAASLYTVISDCDETYNYWEPLHFLLFGQGFQTWEYSPEFAIRSWLYIFLYKVPIDAIQFILPSKIALFFTLRLMISMLTFFAEYFLYRSLHHRYGIIISRFFIILSAFSIGMFNTSAAFLPSSFSMVLNMIAMGFYLREKWFFAIFSTAVSSFLGWPFASILGTPIFIEMTLLRRRLLALHFLSCSILSAIILLTPLIFVDSYFFGKLTLAPLNIVLYNIFKHRAGLYGIEPMSYYFKNMFLNLNVANLLALLSIPLLLFLLAFTYLTGRRLEQVNFIEPYRLRPLTLIYLTMLCWIMIFFTQGHKEERFLSPIYPLIILLAAVAIEIVIKLHIPGFVRNFIAATCLLLFILLSLSRGIALYRNFSGILDIHKDFYAILTNQMENISISENSERIRLCMGKDWHRYHSSFFLPDFVVKSGNMTKIVSTEMQFLESEYRGLLPKHFPPGILPETTRAIPTDMNDMNREERSRYVNPTSCNFIIDTEGIETTMLEPNYRNIGLFKSILHKPILISSRSHKFYRAFYVPFTGGLQYGSIHLLSAIV